MNGPDSLDLELRRLGAELRSLPSVADAVAAEIASRGEVSPAEVERRARPSIAGARFRLPSLAALAGVAALIAVCLWAGLTRESSALAFEEVAARTAQTRSLRAVAITSRNGQIQDRGKVYSDGTRIRFEGDHAIDVADSETGRSILLMVARKEAYRVPLGGRSQLVDLYGLVRRMADAATTPIDDYVDAAGRRYPGFRGEIALEADGNQHKLSASVWSDPETKLPYRTEMRSADSDDVLTLEAIEFDVPLDEKLFDMNLPAGYAFVAPSQDQLLPPLEKEAAAKLTIVPGVGVGPAKFGMTRAELVAAFGEPEFVLFDVFLTYPSQGLQLVLNSAGGELGMIIANPMDAASLTRHEFPGQTDEGIRIGSTEAEVREAYGEPDVAPPGERTGSAGLRYSALGLTFPCVDGKVAQILVVQPLR